MQEELKNKPENFDKIIKQKLENHQIPVDADIWAGIEAGLQQKKKNKIIPFWWWFPIGSAAVLALIFTLSPFTGNRNENTAKLNIRLEEKINTKNNLALKDTTSKQLRKITPENSGILHNNSTKKIKPVLAVTPILKAEIRDEKNDNTNSIDTVKIINTVTTEHLSQSIAKTDDVKEMNDSSIEEITKKELIANAEISQDWVEAGKTLKVKTKKETKPESKIEQKKGLIPDNSITKDWVEEKNNKKSKTEKEVWLAASVGSGNSMSGGGFSGLEATNLNENIVSAGADYTSAYTPNDFTTKEYLPQLSFGLTVQKKIDKVISIETGLIYTYLQSNFSNSGNSNYSAQLNLHYLGIPINLLFQLTQNKHWNIYLSGGGTIEKGLRSIYIENQTIWSQTITTRAATNINGLQYSLSGSLGVSYKIQRNIDIYFEPKFSYYLENNQPISTRTDHPLVIGINGGLRFGF